LDDALPRLEPLQEELRGKRIFIAGGTGFFGKWLLESFLLINRKFALDAKLTVLSRSPEQFLAAYPHCARSPEITYIRGDVRDFVFPPGHFDYIIHAATQSSAKLESEHPEDIYSVVLEGTRRILDLAAASGTGKVLFVSSGAVYGTQPPDLPNIPEDFVSGPDFVGPGSAYGRGKLNAERLCGEYASRHRFHVNMARCFAFVGPYLPLDAHFAIGNFIRDCLEKRPIIIKGDGTPLRSYMYAADLAVWLWTILVKGADGRAYNVGSDQAVSIAELAAEVNRCFGNRNEICILGLPQPGALPPRYVPDVSRAKDELGLHLDFDLARALDATVRWHQQTDRFTIISRDRQSLRDRLPLKKPLALFIEPTNLCNFRCAPCVHGSENTRNDLKPLRHMRMSLYEKLIRELREWDGPRLKLLRLAMLGEPLANPEFCEMVRIAKEANVAERVDTFSNGSLMTEKISARLIGYGLDAIRFSIYAAENKRHHEVTRTNCDVEEIRDNIKRLREMRDSQGKNAPYIFVKMFDTYGEENEAFLNMYRGIADEVGLEKVHNATNYSGNDLVKMYYHNREKERQANEEYAASLNKKRTACPRPFMAMVINNIGDCLMCTHDPAKGTKIGSCDDSTLPELWNGKNLFEFRKMLLENRKHENRICALCDWFKLFPEEDNVDGFPVERLRP
jgi:dTDP-glucose 4,6-dehydratase